MDGSVQIAVPWERARLSVVFMSASLQHTGQPTPGCSENTPPGSLSGPRAAAKAREAQQPSSLCSSNPAAHTLRHKVRASQQCLLRFCADTSPPQEALPGALGARPRSPSVLSALRENLEIEGEERVIISGGEGLSLHPPQDGDAQVGL